jgi:hypothetical protein
MICLNAIHGMQKCRRDVFCEAETECLSIIQKRFVFQSVQHLRPRIHKKSALTSPTNGGRSVGIVRSRTQATELYSKWGVGNVFYIFILYKITSECRTLWESDNQFRGSEFEHPRANFWLFRLRLPWILGVHPGNCRERSVQSPPPPYYRRNLEYPTVRRYINHAVDIASL